MSLARNEGKLDMSNSGRGRRVRKPSDKALAAAQANLSDSSSEDDSSADGRPTARVAITRNKARKRRSESASSGADIDSLEERRSADSSALLSRMHQRMPPTSDKLLASRAHYAESPPAKEPKSSGPDRASSSSALLGAEALMGLAALASSEKAAASAPSSGSPAAAAPPPSAAPARAARAPAPTRAVPPPPVARSKPRKETWTASNLGAQAPRAQKSGAPMTARLVLPKAAPAPPPSEQRTWKRCATHVAIAYYIFYRQRQQLLQHLAVTNPPLAQKMAPYAMDPTYDARLLKERSMEMAKRKQQMLAPPFQYMLNAPLTKDLHNFPNPYAGFHTGNLTPQLQAQFAQQLQSQLAMLQQQGAAGGVPGAGNFPLSPPYPMANSSMHYFGPPPSVGSAPSSMSTGASNGSASAAWSGAGSAQSSAALALLASVPSESSTGTTLPSLPSILEKAPLPAIKDEQSSLPPLTNDKEAQAKALSPPVPAKAAPLDGATS